MRVEDFMTRRVVTITPDTTLLAAAKLMLEHRVGGLPVLDPSARIIGIFSESDLLREEGKGEDGSPWLQMMVGPDGEPAEPRRLDARKAEASEGRLGLADPVDVGALRPGRSQFGHHPPSGPAAIRVCWRRRNRTTLTTARRRGRGARSSR